MSHSTIKEAILLDLEQLPEAKQRQARELVHGLLGAHLKGTPGQELVRFAGTLDEDSARKMLEAIEEGCERVDPHGW